MQRMGAAAKSAPESASAAKAAGAAEAADAPSAAGAGRAEAAAVPYVFTASEAARVVFANLVRVLRTHVASEYGPAIDASGDLAPALARIREMFERLGFKFTYELVEGARAPVVDLRARRAARGPVHLRDLRLCVPLEGGRVLLVAFDYAYALCREPAFLE